VSCQLGDHRLDRMSDALRAELDVRASGDAVERSIGFSIPWSSELIKSLARSGLPRSSRGVGDLEQRRRFVPMLAAGDSFAEASCRLL
jgi:hypothetical protein